MAQLPQQYNTADLPDTGGSKIVLIPDGQYQAVIVESDFKETSNRQGQYLQLKVVITQGQYQNTEFIERLNIINQNPKAVEIAYKRLARISEAVGMTTTPRDSVELHNKPFMIETKTVNDGDWKNDKGETVSGKDKSEIKAFHKMPQIGGVSGFAPQPVNPAQVTAPNTPPWAR